MLSKYKQQASSTTPKWTRVQMLIDLYGETISELGKVIKALQSGSDTEAYTAQSKAMMLVEAIASGIDLQYGDSARDNLRLCEYAVYSISQRDIEGMEASSRAFQTVQGAFIQVRDEANALEAAGEIPPLRLDLAMVDSLT